MTAMATQEPTDPLVLYHHSSMNDKNESGLAISSSANDVNGSSGLCIPSQTEHSENVASMAALPSESGMNKFQRSHSKSMLPPHAQNTPPRSSLAMDPNLTPIASIAQFSKTGSHTAKKNRTMNPSTSTPSSDAMLLSTPLRSSSSTSLGSPNTATPLSEMKRVQQVIPVVRRGGTTGTNLYTTPKSPAVTDQVDALFSPVAQFLHEHSGGEGGLTSIASGDELDEAHETEDDVEYDDDDGSMARPEADDDEDNDKFNPWLFIASLPQYESVVPLGRPPAPLLPPLQAMPIASTGSSYKQQDQRQQKRKTLVLDLDETLVHCKVETVDNPDFCFDVPFNGQNYCVNVKCRPHLEEFLQVVSTKFEVVVFTASQKVYAEKLLNILDPDGIYIHHRLYRDACLSVEGNYLKDLNVLGRDLSQTVLVDNSPHAFGYQIDNGIPIESWWDDPSDKELKKLKRFLLQKVAPATDVRTAVRNKFQSHILVSDAAAMNHSHY